MNTMIHHQQEQQHMMNFPFDEHLAQLMADPEPELGFEFPCSFPGPVLRQEEEGKLNGMEAMREMMFRVAAMQPVKIEPETVRPRKRRNVRISSDPQSIAARHRREKISERIRTLQRLVPGGTKMDTASMLEEAVRYLKFLKREVKSLEEMGQLAVGPRRHGWSGVGVGPTMGNCVARSNSWGMTGPYSIM